MSGEQIVKLTLKTAQVEIEYEGSENFLRSDLLGLITEVAEIHKMNPPIGTAHQLIKTPAQEMNAKDHIPLKLSLANIATNLNVGTGPDLVLAACAYLTFTENKSTFKRKEILTAMKTANSFYKKTYSGNLSKYISSLLGEKKILEQINGVYALSDQAKTEMELKLGS
jgi:hypothetical protein